MGAMIGIWFASELLPILSALEQQARRDKAGDRLQGTLEALGDLRRALGLDERASYAVIEGGRTGG